MTTFLKNSLNSGKLQRKTWVLCSQNINQDRTFISNAFRDMYEHKLRACVIAWFIVEHLFFDREITSLFLGFDTVPIGGSSRVRLPKEDYAHVKSAGKPTAMALRLIDRLFSKETLMKSHCARNKGTWCIGRHRHCCNSRYAWQVSIVLMLVLVSSNGVVREVKCIQMRHD